MATMVKVAAFFRKNSPAIAAIGISAAIVASAWPQTFGLSHYRRLLSNIDKDGKETTLNTDLQLLIERVIRRMNIEAEDESRLEFFVSYPHSPIQKGSTQLRTGAVVGLPASFAYKSTDELSAVNILVDGRANNQRTVDWTSESGQALLNALVLSDKAKAFVIARQLQHAVSYDIHVDIGLRSLFAVLAYTTGAVLNTSLQLSFRVKPWFRFTAYSIVTGAWLLMYIQVSDAVCCWRENRADRKVAKLTRAYAEGGVEYYDSVVRRNKALRLLLGPVEGPRQYTIYGNELSTIRNAHVQLSARHDNLVKYLKEHGVEDVENDGESQKESEIQ